VPWWKSGVTSHSKNWQIWCMRRRCTAVPKLAGGHTGYWLLLLSLCSGTHYSIIQIMSQLLNLVIFIQIFTKLMLSWWK
jgi:hypothetical protein